jgi:hypothetical protein
MKSLALITACALFAVGAVAQGFNGSINFLNRDSSIGLFEPIYQMDGKTLLEGTAWKAQLWGGPVGTDSGPAGVEGGPGSLTAAGDVQVFRTGTVAGYLLNQNFIRYINGVEAGDAALLRVVAWDAKYETWTAARDDAKQFGWSAAFTAPKTGNVGGKTTPEPMIGFKGFSLTIIPEPSTIALGLLGAAALLIRRRK